MWCVGLRAWSCPAIEGVGCEFRRRACSFLAMTSPSLVNCIQPSLNRLRSVSSCVNRFLQHLLLCIKKHTRTPPASLLRNPGWVSHPIPLPSRPYLLPPNPHRPIYDIARQPVGDQPPHLNTIYLPHKHPSTRFPPTWGEKLFSLNTKNRVCPYRPPARKVYSAEKPKDQQTNYQKNSTPHPSSDPKGHHEQTQTPTRV